MSRTRSRRSRGPKPKASGRRRGRRWVVLALAAAVLAIAAGVLWQRMGRPPAEAVPEGLASRLAPEEAHRAALRIVGTGDHLAALPYFREVVRQDPRSSYAHSNLASGLGNGAQQARTHLGRTDNAVRSSIERIAMLKESIIETELAERYAVNGEERFPAIYERGRALETWGFPMDALRFFRAAAEVAPNHANVRATIARLERELANGAR